MSVYLSVCVYVCMCACGRMKRDDASDDVLLRTTRLKSSVRSKPWLIHKEREEPRVWARTLSTSCLNIDALCPMNEEGARVE